MFELFSNVLLCLIPAFLLGVILGWLIWGDPLRSARKQIAALKASMNPSNDTIETPTSVLAEEEEVFPQTPPNLPFGIPYPKFDRRDNLKAIDGIDDYTEQKLNAYGIFTFEQIAHFTPNNILKLGTSFADFPERIEAGNWIEQSLKLHSKEYKENLL